MIMDLFFLYWIYICILLISFIFEQSELQKNPSCEGVTFANDAKRLSNGSDNSFYATNHCTD